MCGIVGYKINLIKTLQVAKTAQKVVFKPGRQN